MTTHALPQITLTPVTSSSISEVGHDPATSTLALRFKNGTLYHYAGVSAETHAKMVASDSIGRFFGRHIGGSYVATRIPHTPAAPDANAKA